MDLADQQWTIIEPVIAHLFDAQQKATASDGRRRINRL